MTRTAKARLDVAGRRFTEEIEAEECDRCRQRFDFGERRAFERRVALRLGEQGVVAGAAVRLLRQSARLETSALARLLGVTRQTVHRWETDRSPIDRATFLVLRLLAEEATANEHRTRDALEKLAT